MEATQERDPGGHKSLELQVVGDSRVLWAGSVASIFFPGSALLDTLGDRILG